MSSPISLLFVLSLLVSLCPQHNASESDAAATSSNNASSTDGLSAADLRLPRDLLPIWYNLTLKIYLPGYAEFDPKLNFSVIGNLSVKFACVKPTAKIVMNAKGLPLGTKPEKYVLYRSNAVVSANGTLPSVTKVVLDEKLEMVTFELSANLEANTNYTLEFSYTTKVADSLAGLYITKYKDDNGTEKYAAITQMESIYARQMVPCWDEPDFKAVWKVQVQHPAGTSATSNGLEESVKQLDEQFYETDFLESPRMSSYLLAIAVTDFDHIQGKTKSGTLFRVWSQKNLISKADYALASGIRVLEYYEDFFGVPFPLPKQDMFALPDFAYGAMENWGMVTYRERVLLYDSATYTAENRARVAEVVAHELAHQWFGNLVTMEWWDDLWLNEGFATYMEKIGSDVISDERFFMKESMVLDDIRVALKKDGRSTSHPIVQNVTRASEIDESFDAISYQKGGAVIRMIASVMGQGAFLKGVQNYIKKHAYSNTRASDLFAALTEQVPNDVLAWNGQRLDIKEFADKWTLQMGYPVVEVQRLSEDQIEITQKRFKYDESTPEPDKYRNAPFWYKWDVPLFIQINETLQKNLTWLHEGNDKASAVRLNIAPNDVLVLNRDSLGYFRVNYNVHGWKAIADALKRNHKIFSPLTRTRLIEDAFELSSAGMMNYSQAFSVIEYLAKEEDMTPLLTALLSLSFVADQFGDEPDAEHFWRWLNPILAPHAANIDWTAFSGNAEEDLAKSRILGTLISLYCRVGNDQECRTKLLPRFELDFLEQCNERGAVASKCSRVPSIARDTVYCAGVAYGDKATWKRMFDLYQKEPLQLEMERLMAALGCTQNTHVLKVILASVTDPTDKTYRLQSINTIVSRIAYRPVGRRIVLDYVLDHWDDIHARMKGVPTLLGGVVRSVFYQLNTPRDQKMLEQFIAEKNATTESLTVFKEVLEAVKTNVKWQAENRAELIDYFKTHTPSSSSLGPVAAA